MRRILLDAGILIRIAHTKDPLSVRVESKIRDLDRAGWELCFAPQAYREAWNALTRPIPNGGYGLPSAQAREALQSVEVSFTLLDDGPDIFEHWRRIVAKYGIVGKSVHDANVVATALAHGATYILTLNERDFRRYDEVATVVP